MCFLRGVAVIWLGLLTTSILHAFDPPVVQRGPLTVRIDGPATITERQPSFAVSVHLKNSANQSVQGTLSLVGIDDWKCNPNEAVPFSVQAETESTLEFQVTPGPSIHAAHYPLHAWARFEWQDDSYVAHPILIVDADVEPVLANMAALPWQPFSVQRDRSLAVRQLSVHCSVIQVFGREPETTSNGWTGQIDSNRASVYLRDGVKLNEQTRDAIAIHPPWADGQVGTAWIEYPLTLPASERITLRFATAVALNGKGDGVTFRVRAIDDEAPANQSGEILFKRHSAAQTWEDGVADLSKWAGHTIRLQLESHPGPDKNTSYDQSYWGEPTLIVGSPPEPSVFPPLEPNAASTQFLLPCGESHVDIRPGKRGLLDAAIGFVHAEQPNLWINGFEVRVAGIQLNDPRAPVTLPETLEEPIENGVRIRHHFITAHGEFDLVGAAFVQNGTFRVHWKLENPPPDQPWQTIRIESLATGPLSDTVHRVYAGHGNVIEKPQAFKLVFDGHRLATSFVGFDFANGLSLLQAVDLPPDALHVDPQQHRYSLQTAGNATFTFLLGNNIWELCRRYRQVNGLQASSGVEKLAGRFVFDLWGGRYGESTEKLKIAFRYGLTDSAVVWHNWQRWGYDYRLPEIYPPHSQGGTEAELKSMIEACREKDVLLALHDNYIDFYPDAEGFSYPDVVAFDNRGRPIKAWLNEGRQARSYRFRADRIAPFLQANLRQIRQMLGPTAYFIDVWSSTKPYDYWTSDGQFFDRVSTRDTWGKHFAWIRELLGNQAPQISESGHDQLIGWLDGAQTNHLRVGKPQGDGRYAWSVWDIDCADAERTPWFDAVHHDRFVLHGAGYSSRYQAGLDAPLHGIYSDDYLSTEMLTGHPAMVSDPFGHDIVRKYWLTHDVMRALAMRTIEDVEFVDDDLHRQRVRWSGDGQVWVNRGRSPWTVGKVVLPEYGFLAQISTDRGKVTAAIYQRNDLIVEQAQSPDSLYVNARGSLGQLRRIRPQVESIKVTDDHVLQLELVWQVDDPIPDGFRPFIHFVDQQGEIAFQASSDPLPWGDGKTGRFDLKANARLPAEYESGDEFELRVGLYSPTSSHRRLMLMGEDDGETRIRLGKLVLEGENNDTSINWTPRKAKDDPFLERNNLDRQPIDFGWIVTAGGCQLTRRDGDGLLIPLPEQFSDLRWELRRDRLPWNLSTAQRIEALSESGRVLREQPTVGKTIVINHDPAVFAYRLTD